MSPDFKKMIGRVIPRWISTPLRVCKNFNMDYGHLKTVVRQECVNRQGEPIPWYTYPAIEYLSQLDFKDKVIFEYGSGNSTLFWAKRCRELISVEHNAKWYEKLQPKLIFPNVTYKLITDPAAYVAAIEAIVPLVDVIVLDGEQRYACAVAAIRKLAPGGMIILDNADWHTETAKYLRSSGLIEVDMAGFSPINHYTLTTSVFLTRDFNFKSAAPHQPAHSIAALRHVEDASKHHRE